MRTTMTIDDDALAAAWQHKNVAEVKSALARQAVRPSMPRGDVRNGVPLLPARADATPVRLELVNQLRDELS